jgi:FkbM family methyltransferase
MNQIRQLGRQYLPTPLRQRLGGAAGWFHHKIIRWFQGAAFDLRGGHFRADGCTFSIPKDQTSRAYRSCFLDGSYEAEERALIGEFVRPLDTVLELGACLGIVSCVTNKILREKTRHVVVEGNPFCIPTLHRNRELNSCGFLVENCAAANEPEATFYLHPVYIVGGTTQRESSRPVRIPAYSLPELYNRHGPFTTLIVDIEGAELNIFSAATEILARVRLIIVELHPWAIGESGVQQCRDLFSAAGLRFKKRAGITEAWQRDES